MAHPVPDRPVAVVTGGTRGIGAAITERLVADGWAVTAVYAADEERATALARRLPNVDVVRADVGDPTACEAAVGSVLERWTRLDHLVNNASIAIDRPVREMRPEDWDAVVRVNLSGAFHMTRAALESLVASDRGRVVNISSIGARTGNDWQANYAASKAGLTGLTRSVARELARHGVTANIVAPGPTDDTAMAAGAPEHVVEELVRRTPTGRLARPDEVAHAVRFLLDDRSAHITGAIVTVDGGLSM